jgi:hypothetical protein
MARPATRWHCCRNGKRFHFTSSKMVAVTRVRERRRGVALDAMVCLNPPPMSASADAGRPVEDAGAEGDSRKQHQEEKKQNKKNISSGDDSDRSAPGELGRTIFSPSRLLPVALHFDRRQGDWPMLQGRQLEML